MTEPVTIDRQIQAARRELGMRRGAYPRFVAIGKMSQQAADGEIAAMQAIIETLERVRSEQRPELPL